MTSELSEKKTLLGGDDNNNNIFCYFPSSLEKGYLYPRDEAFRGVVGISGVDEGFRNQ